MKTSYLFHGGHLWLTDNRNDSYFKRLTSDMDDGDMLLHIPFARITIQEQTDVFEQEKKMILAQTDKSIRVVKANSKILLQQLAAAKTVHITGGQAPKLIEYIKHTPTFVSLLDGKTVGGSSAGACLFASKYWFGADNKTYEGLGVLPIALFVHYGSKEYNATDDKLAKFISETNGLELIKLEEAEWLEYTTNT